MPWAHRDPNHARDQLLILGKTEVNLESVCSILLHGALKRRHGVLNRDTGLATMANDQKWHTGVTSYSMPKITTYYLKSHAGRTEIVDHTANDDTREPGYPTRPPPPP